MLLAAHYLVRRHEWSEPVSGQPSSQRSPEGVLVSVHELPDGRLRFVFDHARSSSDRFPQELTSAVPITWNEYSRESVEQMQLTASQFQEIGENLVSMLVPHIHRPAS